MFTNLLQRQLKKYIKSEAITPEWQEFLEAINRSYEHSERDHLLSKQSLEVSTNEMRELADELTDREARLRKILEEAFDGMIILSQENKVVICNQAFMKLFEYKGTERELIGQDLSLFKTKPSLINKVNSSDKENLIEVEIVRNDGSSLPVEVSISEITMSEKKYKLCILRDISIRLQHQIALKREIALQKQLVTSAREAGMMQVATSVLHNVGNVLNSINIGVTKLNESLSNSQMQNISKIATMIKENEDNLVYFLTETNKGKLLLDYILTLEEYWKKENANSKLEIENILTKLEHLKSIINIQQSGSRLTTINEIVDVNQLLEDILDLHEKEIEKLNILIDFKRKSIPKILLDRSKFFQILENLIRNAIDALKETEHLKKLTVTSSETNGIIKIIIEDNGCGIDPNNLLKIFSFGFTTKVEGHGFGLHRSAILAKELGGQLFAHSDGIGKGAKFTLIYNLES